MQNVLMLEVRNIVIRTWLSVFVARFEGILFQLIYNVQITLSFNL